MLTVITMANAQNYVISDKCNVLRNRNKNYTHKWIINCILLTQSACTNFYSI
jgi:hypothetical protein